MKFSKQRIKKIIKEEISRLGEAHITPFPVEDPDAPEPPSAAKMEAVSKMVEEQIFQEMEEIIVKWGNIMVTVMPNTDKVERIAAELRNVLWQAGFRMPDAGKLDQIEKQYEEEHLTDDEWIKRQKEADPEWEQRTLDAMGWDNEIDVDDI